MADGAELDFPYKKLEAMLKKLGDRGTQKQLMRAMEKTGDAYEAEAVALAPHDKGHLENSSTVSTRRSHGGVRTVIRFMAHYAAKVHELPWGRTGKGTRAKPQTKFGRPGPKYLERVLRGMDFRFFIDKAFRNVLKEAAAASRRRRK